MGEAKRRAWAARPRLRVTERPEDAALVAEIRELERDAPARLATPEEIEAAERRLLRDLEAAESQRFRGIVKLQRPLNLPSAPWLAYPAAKAPRWFVRPSPAVIRAMKGDPKGYFLAEETPDGELEIRSRILDQPW
jgi:hypothetical protein